MALSESYESTIVKVGAHFGFSDFTCSPNEITVRIGMDPDKTRTKGDQKSILEGRRTMVVPFSAWTISSRCESKDVNDHLRELLVRLTCAKRPFDPIWGQPSFGVLWKSNYLYAGSGPFYEGDVLAGIVEFGASLYQDIFQVDQDDEEVANSSQFRRIPKRYFSE